MFNDPAAVLNHPAFQQLTNQLRDGQNNYGIIGDWLEERGETEEAATARKMRPLSRFQDLSSYPEHMREERAKVVPYFLANPASGEKTKDWLLRIGVVEVPEVYNAGYAAIFNLVEYHTAYHGQDVIGHEILNPFNDTLAYETVHELPLETKVVMSFLVPFPDMDDLEDRGQSLNDSFLSRVRLMLHRVQMEEAEADDPNFVRPNRLGLAQGPRFRTYEQVGPIAVNRRGIDRVNID